MRNEDREYNKDVTSGPMIDDALRGLGLDARHAVKDSPNFAIDYEHLKSTVHNKLTYPVNTTSSRCPLMGDASCIYRFLCWLS